MKKLILYVLNFIKFFRFYKRITWKTVKNAKVGLSLTVDSKSHIECDSPCFSSRKNVSMYVSDGGLLSIGGNVFFNENCLISCRKRISIGEGCLFGPNVSIFDHDHKLIDGIVSHNLFTCSEVSIGKNVWIGAGTVVLKGTNIGDNVVIGGVLLLREIFLQIP